MSEKRVSGLFVYPIKSLGGIAMAEVEVGIRGFKNDRRWMLVDPDGTFLSQRTYPKMALLKPELTGDQLTIHCLDQPIEPLKIPAAPPTYAETLHVSVWDSQCQAVCIGKEQDEWFSTALNTACRLVYMPDTVIRPINPKYARQQEYVSFADGYPYLIIGEAALADLNGRLEQRVPMDRFRPNIVYRGGKPYEEDHWQTFRMGALTFRGIKPCPRCQITTIDQKTAVTGKEPLKTLAKYRRQNNEVCFGLNACWVANKKMENVIRVGDEIVVMG